MNRGWPSIAHREAHRCFSVTAAVGFAKAGNFLPSIRMLDRAIIFGLSQQKIIHFLENIELHALSINNSTDHVPLKMIPDYRQPELRELIFKEGLSAPIKFPIDQVSYSPVHQN